MLPDRAERDDRRGRPSSRTTGVAAGSAQLEPFSANAPVGHTSATWRATLGSASTSVPLSGTATAASNPRPTIARPRPSPAWAATATQAPQRIHLPGSYTISGCDVTRSNFRRAPAKRSGSAPYSVASCRSSHVVAFQQPQCMHRAASLFATSGANTPSTSPKSRIRSATGRSGTGARGLLDLPEERREFPFVEALHQDGDHLGIAVHRPAADDTGRSTPQPVCPRRSRARRDRRLTRRRRPRTHRAGSSRAWPGPRGCRDSTGAGRRSACRLRPRSDRSRRSRNSRRWQTSNPEWARDAPVRSRLAAPAPCARRSGGAGPTRGVRAARAPRVSRASHPRLRPLRLRPSDTASRAACGGRAPSRVTRAQTHRRPRRVHRGVAAAQHDHIVSDVGEAGPTPRARGTRRPRARVPRRGTRGRAIAARQWRGTPRRAPARSSSSVTSAPRRCPIRNSPPSARMTSISRSSSVVRQPERRDAVAQHAAGASWASKTMTS